VEKEKLGYWHDRVSNWKDNYGKDYIEWKGTPGIGDAMYGLNIAHMRAFIIQKPVTINIHWYHPKEFYYHFEDPETIIERVDYIHTKYMWSHMVHVQHTFNSDDLKLYAQRYRNVNRLEKDPLARYWMFNPKYFSNVDPRKIVIWRPSFNADTPRWFKLPLNDDEWINIIEKLKNLDYLVVEIDYRTPIREAFYHISSAKFCLSYEGMWHYVAKNLFKPHLVLGDDSVTKWHTPFAIMKNPKQIPIEKKIKRIHVLIEKAKKKQEVGFKNFYKLVFNNEN